MPDNRYRSGCSNDCLRCWRNKLKHANPQAKKFIKKTTLQSASDNNSDNVWIVTGERKKDHRPPRWQRNLIKAMMRLSRQSMDEDNDDSQL